MWPTFKTIPILFTVALVTQSTYAQMNVDPQYVDLIEQAVEKSLADSNLKLQQQRMEGELLPLLEAALEKGQLIDSLELLEYQEADIKGLQKKFEEQKSEIEGKTELSRMGRLVEIQKLRRELTKNVVGLLMEHQLSALTDMSVKASGLPKSLTESFAGKAFELTDKEKQSIRDRSTELSKKVERLFKETRKEACSTLLDGISPERREEMRRFYGKEFDNYFSTLSMEKLVLDFNYEDERQDFLRGAVKKTPIAEILPSGK